MKKILSVLLALCLLVGALPMAALADGVVSEEELQKGPCKAVEINGVLLDGTNQYYKNGDTPTAHAGSSNEWNAKFELAATGETESKLTLNGLNVVDGQIRLASNGISDGNLRIVVTPCCSCKITERWSG